MKNSAFKLNMVLMVVCTTLSMNPLSAQEKTTFEMLQNKVWVMQFPSKVEGRSFEVKYTTIERITTTEIEGQRLEAKSPYYFSDKEIWTFDEQKVGNSKNGKYIIINQERKDPETGSYKEVGIFEILELTGTDLKLKNLSNGSVLLYKSK